MTRFARAKGSKSSNEKKPEEATSWLEMRNSMLLNKPAKPEEKMTVEEPPKIDAPKKKAEWASLGDDTLNESISLIKQHMSKNNKTSTEIKKEKKKKKKASNENQLNPNVDTSKIVKTKNKKQKSLINEDNDSENKVKKKGKKRKLTGDVNESVGEAILPKKKKLQKVKSESSEIQSKKGDETVNADINSKKYQNQMKRMKSKAFKIETETHTGFKGKQFVGGKKPENKKYQERNSAVEELIINGEKIQITKFQGFYVTLEDAERLKKLRSEMIKEGIPKAKLEAAIKLERRRAEKALSRLKKSVCFHCRGHGHLLSNCPNLVENENTGTGICYKCGSTEHSASDCKVVRGTNYQFAECFICKEQGHIARQCPDNPRGLYPQGGACRECGDVTHLRKDCPKVQAQKAEEVITVGLRRDRDLECLDEEIANREKQNSKKKVKKSSTVKF